MKRSILVTLADPHSGHRYGLLNPNTILHELDAKGNVVKDYNPPLNSIQEYLWQNYTEAIKQIKEFARKDDIIIAVDGDLTAGTKHAQRLVSDRVSDQITIGISNLRPLYSLKPKAVKIIKGTGAHTLDFGSSEILISEKLSDEFPNIKTDFCNHALMKVGGMEADISHHGPTPGTRNWLKGNELRYYLRSCMQDEINAGHTPPRLYVRAHYHEDAEEQLIIKANGNRYKSAIVILPSLCWLDDYAEKVAKSPSRITQGLYMFEVIDGELCKIIPITKTIDIRSRDEL